MGRIAEEMAGTACLGIRTEVCESKTTHLTDKIPESVAKKGKFSVAGIRASVAGFLGMPLHFHRAVENIDVWSANSADISFVITFASPNGPGFHGRLGFLATWRPVFSIMGAVKITGSPFNTFADAEAACNTMDGELERARIAARAAQA